MSSIRAYFKLESIGFYPKSKSVYLTVSADSHQEYQKVSILLDRTEQNLSVIGDIIRDQILKVKLTLDSQSKSYTRDKSNQEIIRYRATSIEAECELSTLRY